MLTEDRAYLASLFKRLPDAVPVGCREVGSDGWVPTEAKCHDNVDYWVRLNPAKRKPVQGWLTWGADQTGRCEFVAHSVAEEDGQLVDVTPVHDLVLREAASFLSHRGTEAEFLAVRTRHRSMTYPPVTLDEWKEAQVPVEDDETVDQNEFDVEAFLDEPPQRPVVPAISWHPLEQRIPDVLRREGPLTYREIQYRINADQADKLSSALTALVNLGKLRLDGDKYSLPSR